MKNVKRSRSNGAETVSSDLSTAPTPGAQEPTATPTVRLSDQSNRLTIPLRADGAIDIESMRPATRERLLKAVKTSRLDAGGPDKSHAIKELLPLASMVYSSLGALAMSLGRASGYSAEQASVLLFTEQERAILAEPTARVLVKYSGSLQYADEVILASALLSIIAGKLQALKGKAPEGSTVALHADMAGPVSRPMDVQ